MANKKKNSNYVTAKNTAKKEEKAAIERKKKLKKILIPIIAATLAVAVIVGLIFAIGVPLGMLDHNPEATDHVTLTFNGYSESLHIELYGNDAPETVKHFLDSVKSLEGRPVRSFVDGLLYFGGPVADKGAGKGIKGEFSENGFDNEIAFRRGIIAVARGEDYNSGGAQYFILTEDSTDLNGKYAAFAKITSGMSVIEKIIEDSTIVDGKIENGVTIKSISSHDAHSH